MTQQLAVISVSEVERMAVAVAKSGLFGVSTPDQALALMLVAQSEGRHPASCAKEYHIIKGRPALKADAMLARFQQAGGKVEWVERTNDKVSATFTHEQGGSLNITWTLEDGKRAGLTNNDNWKKYPRQMLSARVISEGVRAVYPSIVSGLYTPEEVSDFAPEEPKKPSISKPVFAKPAPPVENPEVIEAQILKDEVKSQVNPHDDLFRLMDENKVTEDDIKYFCLQKGMRVAELPEFVADFSEKLKDRLVNNFDQIIALSLKK
jgi:hypothetical protein